MNATLSYIKTGVPFVWVGFIGAISFMEAWLKFTAPGVTLATGLSIGKVVFTALNRMEIVFALLILGRVMTHSPLIWSKEVYYVLAVLILVVQSLWVLPMLSARADLYIEGNTPSPSNVHVVFIALEALKAAALLLYGIKQLTIWKI